MVRESTSFGWSSWEWLILDVLQLKKFAFYRFCLPTLRNLTVPLKLLINSRIILVTTVKFLFLVPIYRRGIIVITGSVIKRLLLVTSRHISPSFVAFTHLNHLDGVAHVPAAEK